MGYISSDELSKMELEEKKWFIDELLPEGLTLLYAQPKAGKSALVLYLMIQIALGKKIWDRYDTQPSKMLYLPYDDSIHRFRDRMMRMSESMGLSDTKLDDNLVIMDPKELSRMNIDYLETFIKRSKDEGVKLVVIDTLGQSIDFMIYDSNIYLNDCQNMSRIKKIAEEQRVSLLIVHHEKKGDKLDIINASSGSNGITGTVDTLWRLKKVSLTEGIINTDSYSNNLRLLEVTGKDVISQTIPLEMQDETLLWKLCEEYGDKQLELITTPEQKEVYDKLLKNREEALRTGDIAKELNKQVSTVSQLLRKLQKKGMVNSPHFGYWQINI